MVGGGVLVGLALFAAGLLLKQIGVIFLGLTLIAAAFPMSLVFTNRSKAGRVVFGLVGAFVYLGGLALVPVGCAARRQRRRFRDHPFRLDHDPGPDHHLAGQYSRPAAGSGKWSVSAVQCTSSRIQIIQGLRIRALS